MEILNGVKNLLQFLNDNWTMILVICGLGVSLVKKIKDYIGKSDKEKIEIAKAQIKETVLEMITEAELDYEEWNKAGSIKRSQVIGMIFAEYPILSKVVDQADLVAWIDNEIDTALDTLREVIKQNETKETE